jgi:hypothetical protein
LEDNIWDRKEYIAAVVREINEKYKSVYVSYEAAGTTVTYF